MPVYLIACPDCGHLANALVLEGTRMPNEWACSRCGGNRAQPDPDSKPKPHPWENAHGSGCLCCGCGATRQTREMSCA